MLRIVTGTPAHPHLQWSCFYSNYKQHFLVWITTLWRIICFCTVPLKKKLEFSVFPSNFFLHIKHNWLQNCPAVTSRKKKGVYLLSCSGLNVFVFLFKGDKPELTKSNLGKNQNLTKTDEEIQSFSLSVYWRVNSSGGLIWADSRKHITSGAELLSSFLCRHAKRAWKRVERCGFMLLRNHVLPLCWPTRHIHSSALSSTLGFSKPSCH